MLNPMDMTGKRVLVTGASSGIGRETAILLSRLGATIVAAGRDKDRLQQTLGALQGIGHVAAEFDLGQLDEIPQWMKTLATTGGPFSGLVHSAGLHRTMPVSMIRSQSLDTLMRVNVYGAALLARGFRQRECRAPGTGSVVFLSSVAGIVGEPGVCAYSASKAAIIGLTRSLAMELARENIRVNAVAPGFVMTEMSQHLKESLTESQFSALELKHPMGLGQPVDVAHAIAFLAGDAARWITGTTMIVDGGYTAN